MVIIAIAFVLLLTFAINWSSSIRDSIHLTEQDIEDQRRSF